MFAPLILDILPNFQGKFLLSSLYVFLHFNSPFKSFCTSESLISKDTCVNSSERLDASISSTPHTDQVSLANLCESFATHITKCHANSQSRRSSASISPVEELLDRIQYFTKNSSPCYSETLSRLKVAKLTRADNTAHAQLFHLSPPSEKVSTGLRLRSLLNRYSFLRWLFAVFCNLYNSCLSFCSPFDIITVVTFF